MSNQSSAFDRLLLDSITEGLESLGHNMAHVILYHVEQREGVSKEEMVDDVDLFVEGLWEIFGEGARVIEGLIVEKLYSRLGLRRAVSTDRSFQEYVEDAKKLLLFKGKGDQSTTIPHEHRFP